MRDFLIRIELRDLDPGSSGEVYNQLHEVMGGIGFFNFIERDDGFLVKLPDAEYIGLSDKTGLELRDQVVELVEDVHFPFGMLVVPYDNFHYWQLLAVPNH